MGVETTTTPTLLPLLAFGSVFLLVIGIQQAMDRRAKSLSRHLGRFTGEHVPSRGPAVAEGLLRHQRRFSTIATLDTFLNKQSFAARLDQQLASAGLPIRVGEFLFIRWGCGLVAAAAAFVTLQNVLLAALAGAAASFLPELYVKQRQGKRLNQLNEQLVDALGLVAGGLRAGYSFLQGIEAVVRELPAPISMEFKGMLEDLRIGVPIEEALLGLAKRAPSEDLDMVVTAMLVQRTSGGNLAEVLENISHTIRERIRIRREVMTLTAQERMSSYVIGSLPFVCFGFLSLVNPEYLGMLFQTSSGQMMLVGALILEGIGFVIIRRIVDIKL